MTCFADIFDQEAAIGVLERAIAVGKVPHAYLFEGPPGVGKRLTALALAAALNCAEGGTDSCGRCESCRKIAGQVHPDVRWITLPEGKRRIPIDSVREVERWLVYRAHEGRAKVVIIEPADLLSEPAANALLKTLEEPRSGAFLIVVTAVPTALLPTVRSRCQRVRFKPLRSSTVAALLEQQGLAPGEAATISALGGGSLDRAMRFAGEELDARIEAVLGLIEGAASMTPAAGLAAAAELRGDRGEVLAVLELLLLVLDQLLWMRVGGELGPEEQALLDRLGDRMADLARTGSTERTAGHLAAVHRAITGMQRNNLNPQLALEGLLMAMRGHAEIGADWGRIGAR